MNLVIPDGASVQVIIGRAAPLALTDEREAHVPAGRRGAVGLTILKLAGVGVLIIGSYFVGETRGHPANADSAVPEIGQPVPILPSQNNPGAPPPTNGQVPPGFSAQLQAPPTIQPPSGPTGGTDDAAKNPFGLSN